MAGTVRVTREPDYFPLLEGYTLRYEHTSNRFEGTAAVEVRVAQVRAFRDDAAARIEASRELGGSRESSSWPVKKSARELSSDGALLGPARLEFPLPALPGKRWSDAAGEQEVAGAESAVEVPAGRFVRCLRVNARFPGGTSIRYYAPGVGLVYEERLEGDAADRLRLASFKLPR